MKLAKALKEKNILIKEIKVLQERFQTYNSTIVGSEIPYPAGESFSSLILKQEELINLKIKIFVANAAIQEKIFRISEYKNIITILRSTSTESGLVKKRDYTGSTEDEYISVFKTLEVDNLIKKYEELINSIQEEIDAYNHLTEI